MSIYVTSAREDRLFREAKKVWSRPNSRTKHLGLQIQPLLYVYSDGGVWMYGDAERGDGRIAICYHSPEHAARALQEFIERTVAEAKAAQEGQQP
jgi:hypothetical protein